MSYKRNIASNFVTQICVSILAFITSIIIARTLGSADKGYAAYLILIFTLIGEYGNFGLLKATIFFQKRTDYQEEYIYSNNQSFVTLNFLIIAVIIIVLRVGEKFLSAYSFFHVACGLVIIFFTFSNLNLNNFYIGNERIRESNKYNILMSLFRSITLGVLWMSNRLNVDAYVGVFSISMIFLWIMLYRNSGVKWKFTLDFVLLRKQILFGFWIYSSTLLIYLNYRIDQFLIKGILGVAEMGVYSVSVSLAELLFLIPGSVGTAILGKLYNIDFSSIKERKNITAVTVKYTFYICLGLGIVGMAMTPLIPWVYGSEYAGASMPTLILFIGVIFASIGKVSSSYFQSIGNTVYHLIITGSTFSINVILNFILIPRMGINGAAVASSISYFMYGVLYIIAFIKIEEFSLRDFFR